MLVWGSIMKQLSPMLQFINRAVIWEKGQRKAVAKQVNVDGVMQSFLFHFPPFNYNNYAAGSSGCGKIDAKVIYLMIWREAINQGLQIVLYLVRLLERLHPGAQWGVGEMVRVSLYTLDSLTAGRSACFVDGRKHICSYSKSQFWKIFNPKTHLRQCNIPRKEIHK